MRRVHFATTCKYIVYSLLLCNNHVLSKSTMKSRFFVFSRGKVIGRRLLHLRICTCPKRDFESEEKNREKQLSKNVLKCTPTPTAGKQQIMHGGKRKAFWVLVSYY